MTQPDIRTQQLIDDANIIAAKMEDAIKAHDEAERSKCLAKLEALGADVFVVNDDTPQPKVLWTILYDEGRP